MISFIVQARGGSTRLPNKMQLPFYKGKNMLELLIAKLRQIKDIDVIIATSVNPDCDAIEQTALACGAKCFRGSENDVLQRFIDAAEHFGVDRIIRVCADNPFLELDGIRQLIAKAQAQDGADYISFNIGGHPSIKTHYGFWTEYVTLNALKRVRQISDEKLSHEHVTIFIYSNPEQFNIQWIDGPASILTHQDIRLTIDTLEDFQSAQQIYADICDKNPYPTIDEVVAYLDDHQTYYRSMRQQIENNSK